MRGNHYRGFTLIEMVLSLGIAALVIIGIFLLFDKVSSEHKINKQVLIDSTIIKGLEQLYINRKLTTTMPTYEGLTNATLIKSSLLPAQVNIVGGRIINVWGREVIYNSAYMEMNVPNNDICLKYILKSSHLYNQIAINNIAVKNISQRFEVTSDYYRSTKYFNAVSEQCKSSKPDVKLYLWYGTDIGY